MNILLSVIKATSTLNSKLNFKNFERSSYGHFKIKSCEVCETELYAPEDKVKRGKTRQINAETR